MLSAAVIGGSGITGKELVKLLLKHRGVKLTAVTSRQYAGIKIAEVLPELAGLTGLSFISPDAKEVLDCGVAFVCLPHTEAMKYVKKLTDAGVRAIDLSADFRIHDAAEYKKWYKTKHLYPALLKKAVYGLPEFYPYEIKNAKLVANSGCYAGSILLGIAPAVSKLQVKEIIADAKTGISGAGANPTNTNVYMNINENVIPYNFGIRHRHIGEIKDVIKRKYGRKISLVMTPQLTSMDRGMLCVMYMKLKKNVTQAAAEKIYADFYADNKFIRIKKAINLHDVQNTNFCDLLIDVVPEQKLLMVMSAIDNIGKGASWQAVQNMNLMFGFDETEGLL